MGIPTVHERIHELASTTGIGRDHTVSGLTAGQALVATGAEDVAFQVVDAGVLDLTDDYPWTGLHTHSQSLTANGGLDLGTSGLIDSNVADASSAVSILLQPSVALTSGSDRQIFRVNDTSGNPLLVCNADETWAFGGTGATGSYLTVNTNSSTEYFGINFTLLHSGAGVNLGGNFPSMTAGGAFTSSPFSGATANEFVGGFFFGDGASLSNMDTDYILGGLFKADGTIGKNSDTVNLGGWYVIGNDEGTNVTTSFGGYIEAHTKGADRYGLILEEQTGGTINVNVMNEGAGRVGFRDSAIYVYSSADGVLNLIADDSVRLGPDTTNYVKVDSNGTLSFQGTATVYEDLQVSISNIRVPAANAPTERLYDGGTGGVTFPFLGFDVDDYIYFDVQTSHSMKLNTVLENHIHFSLPNTTTIGDRFQFQVDVMAAGIDTVWEVPAGSPFASEHVVAANDNTYHRLLDIADIDASNDTVSTVYKCKLTRIDATADEYGSEVYVTFSDCHYEKDTVGSNTETAK